MPHIETSLKTFKEHLEKNIPVVCTPSGVWQREGFFSRIIRRPFCSEDTRLAMISEGVCKALDNLEQKPVAFSTDKKITLAHLEDYNNYFKTAEAVQSLLKSPSSKKVQQQLHQLDQKITGLKYRLESSNGGLDRNSKVDDSLLQQVIILALVWKKNHALATESTLFLKDLIKLEEACQYSEFANLLSGDKALQEQFFNWALRDGNGVRQFIEFPSTCQRLAAANLAGRIGRFGADLLQIKKIPMAMEDLNTEKVLMLPFFNGKKVQHINILDESREVVFNEGWRLTIKKVFEIFQEKTYEPGDLEFFSTRGIMNWNVLEFGGWDPEAQSYKKVNLDDPDWLKQLPLFETVTKDVLEKRCNVVLDEGDWLAIPRSTRESTDHALEGRHSFLELAIPTEDGRYALYPFGKFTAVFPRTVPQLLSFLLNTVAAKVAYPDENPFNSHRQHAVHPLKLNANDGQKLLEIIRQDIIKGREGNLIFQFRRENCAYWVQQTLDKVQSTKSPDLFKGYMIESRPTNPVFGGVFSLMRKAPKSCQSLVIRIVDYIFGAWRGITVIEDGKKVFKSFASTPHHEHQYIYQPGCLHQKIEEGKIKGLIFLGH